VTRLHAQEDLEPVHGDMRIFFSSLPSFFDTLGRMPDVKLSYREVFFAGTIYTEVYADYIRQGKIKAVEEI
jgi:hypothetical protein